MCICEWGLYTCRYPWGPEENIGSPGVRVTGDCEPSDVGVGNWTPVLLKSIMSS